MRTIKSFISGLIYGVAVGVAIGALFAPKKGEELRENINDAADNIKNTAEDWYETAVDTARGVYREGKKIKDEIVK